MSETTPPRAPGAAQPVVLVLSAPERRQPLTDALLEALPSAHIEHVRDPQQYARVLRGGGLALAVVTVDPADASRMAAILQARHACPVLAVGPAEQTRLIVDAVRHGAADYVADTRLHELGPAAARLVRARPVAAADRDPAHTARWKEGREAVLVLDRHWIVAGGSPSVAEVLGHEPASLAGQPLEVLLPDTIESSALLERLRGCSAGESLADAAWMLRRDGLRMWAEITCEVEGHGPKQRFRLVVRDATLQLRASQFLRGQADSAAASAGARNLFLGSVAHELRSALAPISTSAILLERNVAEPARQERLFGIIRRNAESAARLLDDLLTFSTASESKLLLRVRDVDLHVLLAECTDVARQAATAAGVELRVDCAATHEQARLRCDPDRIRQVLVNLLGNAVKFTPAGGSIRVRTSGSAEGFAVEVSDTGVGIDPAALPFIFDPYEQGGGDTTRRFGGFGLGLAICAAIARQHGGKVVASSAGPGQGSTFRLCLPANAQPASAATDPREPSALHVLYVEDNADAANAMRYALGTLGWSMTHAGTCAAARALASRDGHPFDVVLADLGLPDGSGLELGAELGNSSPFVALTAYGAPLAMQGFASQLIKPAEISEVQRALLKAVAVHRSTSMA